MSKKKSNIWMIISVFLFIILAISIFTRGFSQASIENTIKDLNYLNSKESSPELKASITGAIANLEKRNVNTNSGQVLIEEYSDFQCPFCGKAFPIVAQLKAEYGDKINIVFKQFPLSSIHPYAQKAAEASECARDQGKFWEYHDLLFTNQNALTIFDLKKYASQLSLDTAAFNTCLDTGGKASVVSADFKEGQKKGVQGTPTFFIGGEKLVGALPYESFKAIIDSKLA